MAFVSKGFLADTKTWISPDDHHWNGLGCERIALGLMALIDDRDLLSGRGVQASAEARREFAQIFEAGAEEAADRVAFDQHVLNRRIQSVFHYPPRDRREASMVSGGLNRDGILGPFASFCLRRGAGPLVIRGAILERVPLRGARMSVFVDDVEVGSIELDNPGALPATFAVPARFADSEFVSVRLYSDDYAYIDASGEPGCLELTSLGFE